MTKFYEASGNYFIFNQSQMDNIVERLPVGNFVIRQHPMTGQYFFEKYDKEFLPPPKVYGNAEARARRIINTFLDRPTNTGVLLSGEKGSGKTMLAKLVSHILAAEHGVPTIFITEPHTSQQFMELIGSITQPVIVMFDEFEKVYDEKQSERFGNHDQKAILTLLDGIFSNKTLYLLTCNDRFAINDHMINRPGRLFYSYEFEGLEEDFVREYVVDNLEDKSKLESVVKVCGMFRHFSFDMLQALVQEMNRYGEDARESLLHLNINPGRDHNQYAVSFFPMGSTVAINVTPDKVKNPIGWKEKQRFYTYELPKEYNLARLGKKKKGSTGFEVHDDMEFFRKDRPAVAQIETAVIDDEDEQESVYTEFHFSAKDIKVTSSDGFELVNDHGEKLILTKEVFSFDWRAL